MRWVSLALLLAIPLGGLRAAAQDVPAPVPVPGSSPSAEEESPELRALRLAELELFAPGTPLADPHQAAGVRIGDVPPAFTSDAPPEARELATGSADLAWLRGLELPDIPVRWDERVIRFLLFFRDDPRGRAHIQSWLRRVDRYGPMMRRALRDAGLPEDLIYVSMVESGFDPRARSDAGAVGLWQLMRPTGEEYGLSADHWVDQRQDPERSTTAGGRYLADLYRRFGTWELAFAAFNMGYGALLRAIRKYNTNDYWQLARLEAGLPFETRIYVAKILACAIVGRNPERFGHAGVQRDAERTFERVTVPGGTPLGQISRAAGVELTEIQALNPELLRTRVPPGQPEWSVRIPAGRSETFQRAWARNRARRPTFRPYVVRFGEDLDAIARRMGTTVAVLRRENELAEGARVAPGFALVVPANEPRPDAEVAADAEPPVAAVPAETFAYADRRRVFYRAMDGDTARDVARFFTVTVDELRRWNSLDPSAVLQRGMILQLFVPPAVDLARAVVLAPDAVRILTVGSEEFFAYHESQRGRVRLRYRVRAGDTLTSIGARYDLSVGSIARINDFPNDTLLRVDQEIVLYVPREAAAAADADTDTDTAPAPATVTAPATATDTVTAPATATDTAPVPAP